MEKIKSFFQTRYDYYNMKKNEPLAISLTHPSAETFETKMMDNYTKHVKNLNGPRRSISEQKILKNFRLQKHSQGPQSAILSIEYQNKLKAEEEFEIVIGQTIKLLEKKDWIKMIDDIRQNNKTLVDFNPIDIRFTLITQKFQFEERHKMWRLFFDENKQKMCFKEFRKMKHQKNNYTYQIQLDVKRTQITNDFFKKSENQKSLQNILQAYSNYDIEVGYTQGMNFIAGNLLACYDLKFNDQNLEESVEVIDDREELVFYQLVEIMICKQWRGYFSDGFPQLIRSIYALECWCQEHLPKLFDHFQILDLDFQSCFAHLYLSLMMNNSPEQFNKTIIDLFLFEGEIIVQRLIVAMLTYFKKDMIKMSFENLHQFCRNQMTKDFFKLFTNKEAVYLLSSLGLASSQPIHVRKMKPNKPLFFPPSIQNRMKIYLGC